MTETVKLEAKDDLLIKLCPSLENTPENNARNQLENPSDHYQVSLEIHLISAIFFKDKQQTCFKKYNAPPANTFETLRNETTQNLYQCVYYCIFPKMLEVSAIFQRNI